MTRILIFILFLSLVVSHWSLVHASPLGSVNPPPGADVGPGALGVILIIRGIITLIMIVGFVAALFCLLISAIGYLFSGGDPKSAAAARGRIMACIIGLIILLSVFGVIYFLQVFFGANIIVTNNIIPSL